MHLQWYSRQCGAETTRVLRGTKAIQLLHYEYLTQPAFLKLYSCTSINSWINVKITFKKKLTWIVAIYPLQVCNEVGAFPRMHGGTDTVLYRRWGTRVHNRLHTYSRPVQKHQFANPPVCDCKPPTYLSVLDVYQSHPKAYWSWILLLVFLQARF